MKLYGTPGACSLAPHIALREAGQSFDYVKVDLQTRKLADGRDLSDVSDKGYVPVLELDDGQRLTEASAILQYIADRMPAPTALAPAPGTLERFRLQEWLAFTSSEVHKAFGPQFAPGAGEDAKQQSRQRVMLRLGWVDGQLAGRDYTVGESYTVADIYLFVVASWARFVGLDISSLQNLGAFLGRIAGRPAVQAALRAEGLVR